MTNAHSPGRGLAAALTAFTAWGLFPLYFRALAEVPATQVIAHRVVWSCLFLLALLLARGELDTLSRPLTQGRLVARLTLSAFLISSNWLVYVWAVAHGHVIDTSLGYYINPLMNVV